MTEFFARIEKELDGLAGASLSRLLKRKYDTTTVKANWLAVLEDYPKSNFHFPRFPDQCVEVTWQGGRYLAFGTSGEGVLAEAADGTIRLLNPVEELFDEESVFVNSNSDAFVRCYCLFMAAVFTAKGYRGDLIQHMPAITDPLRDQLTDADPPAMAEPAFWSQLHYMLDDLIFPLAVPILDYLETGRMG